MATAIYRDGRQVKSEKPRCRSSLYGACAVVAAVTMLSFAGFAVDIPSGSVELETDPSVPNPVPSAVTDKAAFWMDMSETSVVSADGGVTLSMWRDCRETAAKDATPTLYYATPAWTNGGEGSTVSHEYQDVNPALQTLGAAQRKTLYFRGRSGIYLRLKKNGANATLSDVRHVFAVHNPSNWFGAVVGEAETNRRGCLLLQPNQNSYVYKMGCGSPFFWSRVDLSDSALDYNRGLGFQSTALSVSVDGEIVDPYSYNPHKGWQLFDFACQNRNSGPQIQSIFFQRYENSAWDTGHRAGGDYLSELVVFTNQLSSAEIAAVRTYLNNKWKLPVWRDPEPKDEQNYLVEMQPVETVDIGPSATAQASVAAEAVSRPFCLAGDGAFVKSGAGALVIGASQALWPYAGSFNLLGGSVYLRGGAAPAIAAVAGRTLTSEDYVPGDNTIDNQARGAVKLTVSDGAGTAEFVKAGACQATVSDVAADVAKVTVQGGELTLGAATSVGYRSEVAVPNGDFEASYHCPSGDNNYSKWAYNLCAVPTTGSNGWYSASSSSVYFQRVGRGCTFADGSLVETAQTTDGKKWSGAGAWNLASTVGAGNQIINIQNGGAFTKVSLPADGCYELTFDMSERYSYALDPKNARPVEVRFGTGVSDWQTVAYCQATERFWTNVRVFLPKATAGEHVIGFALQALNPSQDCSVYVDNVRLRFASVEPRDTYAIPNGDFERMDVTMKKSGDKNYWSVNYLSTDNVAQDWTFVSPASPDGQNPLIGIVNPNIYERRSAGIYATRTGSALAGRGTHGTTALLMLGDQVSATTTFTPPAGKWRLRQRLQRAFVYASGSFSYIADKSATCKASVTAGGKTTDLGQISDGVLLNDVTKMKRYDYPTEFETDGVTPVTLTLTTANTNVGVLVDDLELVGENSIADREGELVKNGGFEDTAAVGWTSYTPPMPEGQIERHWNGTGFRYYIDTSSAYGAIRYEGMRCCMFKNLCGAKQEIVFPKEGLYRLRFGFRSRADGSNYANGDFAVKLWRGADTNQLAFINYQYQRNFAEREYLFRVPEAGSYTLGFENYGRHNGAGTFDNEATCFIDGVSVCLVDWTVPETLSINEGAKISVADGATLNLAFTGTNKVRSVFFGGKGVLSRFAGQTPIVNSRTCPDFVSGPGSLELKPRGMMLLFR